MNSRRTEMNARFSASSKPGARFTVKFWGVRGSYPTVDGNTLAVGVYDEAGSSRSINGPIDAQRNGAGAVYVFRRAATAWTREAYIKTWNAEAGDSWGAAVSLSES